MASEIRVNKLNSQTGVGTITLSPTGVDISGITTAATLRATTGIVTSLTAGSLTSLGAVSGTTGTFSGAVSGTTGTFTGDVDIADKIVHTGDTNTAIRFSGADTVSIETAGSERVRVDSSGNLQVVRNVSIDNNGELAVFEDDTSLGYTNSAKLSLDYASNVARIRSSGNGSFTSRPLALFITNTEALRIDTSGKVGINETSPAAQLDVKGSGVPIVINSSNSNTYKIQLENAGSTLGYIGAVTDSIVFSNSSAAEQARFTDSGLKLPSGRGIDFSATSDASGMSSDLLDDYEEGTFSPIPDAGGGVTFTYAHNTGFYTKIGNTVTFQIYLMFYASTITGGNSGNGVAIQGLPFTIKNNARYNPAFTVGRTYNFDIDSDKRIYAYGDYNSTNIRMMVESDDNVGALLTAGQVDTSTCLTFISGTYQI